MLSFSHTSLCFLFSVGSLFLVSCSNIVGGHLPDDVQPTPEPSVVEDTPQESTPTSTPAPTPLSWEDQLGSYVVRDVSCSLESGVGLVVTGSASVVSEISALLCAWGGTAEMPFHAYSCTPGVEHIPVPGEWVAFRLETGYIPEGSSDPENIDCVLCASQGSSACYSGAGGE